jgi:co-chaperonin GroES (HSP10)
MNAIDQNSLTELIQELPINASADQSNCPPGKYRTTAGNYRKFVKRGRPYTKVIDPNNFAPVGKSTRLIPVGDEMIVRCDKFKDEAQCRECSGSGASGSTCLECGGTAVWRVDENGVRDKRSGVPGLKEVPCQRCLCSTYDSPFRRSTGKVPCIACKGTGQLVGTAGITIAAQYEAVPTTGIIMAIGPDVTRWNRGDRCLFDTFTGKEYEYEGRKYRIIKQQYPMCLVVGQDDVRITDAAAHLMP